METELGFSPIPKTIFEQVWEEGQSMRYNVKAHFESNLTTEEQALFIPFFWQHTVISMLNYSVYTIIAFYIILQRRP